MIETLLPRLGQEIGEVLGFAPVQGGDISRSYQVTTARGRFFLKLNTRDRAEMFQAESRGLRKLHELSGFKIPKVLDVLELGEASGLLMEWIESSEPDSVSWHKFWAQLSELHSVEGPAFGLDFNNFIGVLDQRNDVDENWVEFWIERRMSPLVARANEKGYLKDKDIPPFLVLFEKMRGAFGKYEFKPRLLHGDLWHGNLMFDVSGDPVLIDPAIYFGWPEMELAFMRFFGGFSKEGQDMYRPQDQSNFLGENFDHIWQLYPLLVHTILFGGMYPRRLMNTVKVCQELI